MFGCLEVIGMNALLSPVLDAKGELLLTGCWMDDVREANTIDRPVRAAALGQMILLSLGGTTTRRLRLP